MKTKTLFLSLFFVLTLIVSLFSVLSVNAEAYYNHIENPSFVLVSDYCEDGGFESGAFNSGVEYGNWSTSSAWAIGAYPNTGVYGAHVDAGSDQYLWYNFTSSYYFLGADVSEFSFYVKSEYANLHVVVTFYYSDYSSDMSPNLDTALNWIKVNATSSINDSKYVVALRIHNLDGYWYSIDNVVFSIDDGGMQTDITLNSYPWYLGQTQLYNFGEINSVFGCLDSTSVQFTYSSNYWILQNINYLDVDYVHFLDCWVYGYVGQGVDVWVLYSDRTSDHQTRWISINATWEHLNFGSAFLSSNKYIIMVGFSLTVGVPDFGYSMLQIDDCGLWATVPLYYNRFDFSVSPSPISISSMDFSVYSNTAYSMTCYLYNSTTYELNENGTYSISSAFGVASGSVVNGVFTVSLAIRSYSVSPYTVEQLGITIITPLEVMYFQITVYWYPVSGDEAPDIIDTGSVTNWVILALIIFMPSFMIASIGAQLNATMGIVSFLGGLTLMGAVTLSIGMIDLWFMIAIIIVDVLLIIAMLKGNNSS